MDSTIAGSENDTINMDSTIAGSVNENITMDSTTAGQRITQETYGQYNCTARE